MMSRVSVAFFLIASMIMTSCSSKPEKKIEWNTLCDGIFDIEVEERSVYASPGDNIFDAKKRKIYSTISDVTPDNGSNSGMDAIIKNEKAPPVVTCSLQGKKFSDVDGDLTLTYRIEGKGAISEPQERRSSERVLLMGMDKDFYFLTYRNDKLRTDMVFECQVTRKSETDKKYQMEARVVDNLLQMSPQVRQQVLVNSVNREASRIGCLNRIEVSDYKELTWAPRGK